MRPAFLTRPQAWTVAPRTAQSAIDTACAVERYTKQKRDSVADALIAVLFVCTLGAIALGAL